MGYKSDSRVRLWITSLPFPWHCGPQIGFEGQILDNLSALSLALWATNRIRLRGWGIEGEGGWVGGGGGGGGEDEPNKLFMNGVALFVSPPPPQFLSPFTLFTGFKI